MERYETDGPVTAVIDLGIRGDIDVNAGNRNAGNAGNTDEVTVEVLPRNPNRGLDAKAADLVQVAFSDGRLSIRLRRALTSSWFTDGGAIEVRVTVPIGSSLDLRSGMGELRCEGHFGAVRLATGMGHVRLGASASAWVKTGYGDILIERIDGDAELHTGSGDIRVDDIGGTATTRNGNGATVVGAVGGALTARSSNGDITVDEPGSDVHARTANGSLRVGSVARGVVTLGTASGAIDVGVREGTAAWLDVASKYGRVHNALAATDGPGTGDTAEIRARTSYGDLTIHRSPK